MSVEPLLVCHELEAVFASGFGVGPATFAVAPGEQVLLLGPSGSGKSTLLRMLHGAVPHAIHARVTGSVTVAGRDVGEVGVAALADVVGVVAQDPTSGVCLPEVDDELAFPLENLCVDPGTIPGLVRQALAAADAAHLAGRKTEQLSGGELQRIALAAATVAGPELLLLDEPTSMLDASGVDGVRRAIGEVRRRTGAAVVLVEHRLDEFAGDAGLAGLPARWIVLDRSGRVRFDGPASDLTDCDVRDLLAAGCWLPAELEERVLGVPDARATGTPVAARREGPSLVARGLAVAPGGAPRRGRVEPVLTGIDLELRSGEVAALVGANGQGKSSLLTCLAGLHKPVAGTVEGPGAGLVFQNPEDQFRASTVRAEVDSDDLLARFDLADLAEVNPHQLSGGQKRRLSLAAMLVLDHPFLLADEPGFGLDRHATIAVMAALRAAAAEGRGVLFSSHDLRTVAATADRVLVIGEGTVLADTSPRDLLQDPRLLARAGLSPSARLVGLAGESVSQAELAARLQHADVLVTRLARAVAA